MIKDQLHIVLASLCNIKSQSGRLFIDLSGSAARSAPYKFGNFTSRKQGRRRHEPSQIGQVLGPDARKTSVPPDFEVDKLLSLIHI